MICFRIPNEELKQAFFREPVHLSYIRFRIPNEELKHLRFLRAEMNMIRFRIPNEELKLIFYGCLKLRRLDVLEYLMRN